jgi:O-antigen/teichoic acid export membrane protein
MINWRRIASQSIAIFAARLVGAAAAFLTQVLISRAWGAATLGDYLYIVAGVNIVATVMPLGFQVVGAYFAAEYQAFGAGRSLRAYAARAYGQAALVALALTAAGACAVYFYFGLDPRVVALGPPSLVMTMATAIVYLNGALLVGLKRPLAGLTVDILCRPMFALAGFILAATLLKGAVPLEPMLWIGAISYALVAAIQSRVVLRAVRALPAGVAADRAGRRRWWRFALPWIAISLAADYFFDLDLLLASRWMTGNEVAVFGVCARICSLLAFAIGTVYTVTMPDIFEAGARRDAEQFQRRIGDANLIAAALAIFLSILMFNIGPLLALVFGPEFAAAQRPLGILTLGLAARAVLGPASLVLSFHDRPYAALPAAAMGLVALVGANAALVPFAGIEGAAWAATAAMTLWSAVLWLTARRDVHLDVSILPRLKTLFARSAA